MFNDEKKSADAETRVSKGDTKKAKRKPKAKKPKAAKVKKTKTPKAPKAKKPNKAERRATAEDAKAQAEELVRRFARFEKLKDAQGEVSKETGLAIKAAFAALKTFMEEGTDYNAIMGNDAIAKLKKMASLWQGWLEAQAEAANERKEARKATRAAMKAMSEAVEETRQMSFRW